MRPSAGIAPMSPTRRLICCGGSDAAASSRCAAPRPASDEIVDNVNQLLDDGKRPPEDAMPDIATELDTRVAAVRRFSRFYSRRLGMLQDAFLQTSFSLAEARVLYELAQRDQPTASEIADTLGI